MGQGSIKNLNFSFLRQVFQYCLLGLNACRLRFASHIFLYLVVSCYSVLALLLLFVVMYFQIAFCCFWFFIHTYFQKNWKLLFKLLLRVGHQLFLYWVANKMTSKISNCFLVWLFFGLYSYFSISCCYSVLALLLLFVVMYYCCFICKNTLRSLSTLLHLLLSYFLLINLILCIPKYVNYELFYY